MLKKADIKHVDQAQNGYDGFVMTKNANYDFIICDLNMPVMDGYECAIKIKDFYKNSNQIFEVSKNN